MTPAPKLLKRAREKAYKPILSRLERRAYAAAHRIMTADLMSHGLAAPGGIRSRTVDRIAQIIKESIGGQS